MGAGSARTGRPVAPHVFAVGYGRSGVFDAIQGPFVDGDARVAVAGRYGVLEDGEMVE
jgi:hypothetical protein